LTLVDCVLARLREESVVAGKERHFEVLKEFIGGDYETGSYENAARALGMSEGAANVAAHRLRRRFRAILRAEIAQTVADPREVDDEICGLFDAFGS
jgi:RNA polymerase sigma-70 factor (ECF subfamily)